ncbi:DUF4873 domain-containing protein [Nocardia brasiliensis]|uniref:DUF4873 domain-containing protein n=1 Tax=Nocardia brasiliensis (strain ATCC 700358 / HUJEG-1) TaxID=1133849 RepID=K0EJ21_NOCB7|nr:DUF4873 domain-containing protein [Nocardia brasiliensis]AFT99342.1 hypothetical protein O3I_006900 [Nocardia brasiliensis ATCC 700358]OCF90313.1 monooxygenase [Nocardia brasiliensis]
MAERGAADGSPHDRADYFGAATLVVRGVEVPVRVELRGYPEPTDGVYRWVGRVDASDALTEVLGDEQRTPCVVRTDAAARPAVVGDRDLWNRYRIMGKSTPPYPLA